MKLNDHISEPKQLNALALAYMGDAVQETYVRYRLLSQGKVRPYRLHQEATKYVSAKSQARILEQMMKEDFFSEEEYSVIKRGRNAKSGTIPKNTDARTYGLGTSFEALLGYLYVSGETNRLDEIMARSFDIIDEKGGVKNGR